MSKQVLSLRRARQSLKAKALSDRFQFVSNFKPDHCIIRTEQISLNGISPYLASLPATATALLLVAPHNLAKIDGQGFGTWFDTIDRIRKIDNYHGLDGMRIFEPGENFSRISYERLWASQIKTAWEYANCTRRSVTTGLFLGTKEIVHGATIDSTRVAIPANLYSLRNEIGQQGQSFYKKVSYHLGYCQWSCTEPDDKPDESFGVSFANGKAETFGKRCYMPARPVCLEIRPCLM